MEHALKHDVLNIASKFKISGDYLSAAPYGSGHINDTYAVTYNQGGRKIRYIIQRINHNIFKDPISLMENVQRVTSHLHKKLLAGGNSSRRALQLLGTKDNSSFYKDAHENYWRTYIFIEDAVTYDIIQNPAQAFQAARAFGEFQKNLSDLPGTRLHETIPDFHNTPKRFENLEKAVSEDKCNRVKFAKKEIDSAMKRKDITSVLLSLNAKGKIPERITHNDTKLNNVMLDNESGEGICVIDLDTVMPGLALYDFGDLVRTSTSPSAEDEKDLSKIKLQMHMFEALAKGYLDAGRDFLTPAEIEYLPFSGKLITFEIGLRFLTDYLSGDKYFKIHRKDHNLDRCRTQFRLVECIEEEEENLSKLVSKLK